MEDRYRFGKCFAALCASAFIVTFISRWTLLSDDVYYDALGEQLSFSQIKEIVDLNKKWNWLVYPVIPILYFIKIVLVAICLSAGAFALKVTVDLKSLLKIALFGEFVFLLASLTKLFWFGLIFRNYNLNDLQNFAPLSILGLFDLTDLQPWLIYPLSQLNLFEVLYVVVLSYFLTKTIKSDFSQSLKLVVFSYGAGLTIWVVFIMFISVSVTP